MTSKWLKELEQEIIYDTGYLFSDRAKEILYKIDALLKRAMYSVDSEILYDMIREETREEDGDQRQL